MIPPIDPTTKLLPPTADGMPYQAKLDDVRQLFVDAAPHRGRRETVFAALTLYSRLVWNYWPDARLWVNGGFVTHKEAPPHDVDVAFLVPSHALERVFETEEDALSLLTLQGVTVAQPPFTAPRVQPFGGLVDSFFCPSDVPVAVETWRDRWSMASTVDGKGYRSDVKKGFLEVTQ